MKKNNYTVVTWPESQDFIGNDECILICPPATDIDPTALDDAYLVPEDLIGPIDAGEAYVRVPWPKSQRWDDANTEDPDDVLRDYETQDVYVRQSILN